MPNIRYRRRLRLILLAVGAPLVTGALTFVILVVSVTTRAAENALAPPHLPLGRTPHDVGIAEYADVAFATEDGITLRGWYVAPHPEVGTAIVFAHGYAQNRAMFLPEAAMLAGRGYGALLFDFRGHGESDAALVTIGDHERRDLAAAIDYVAAQPHVSTIGGVGFSMGGAVLAQVAAQDERLSAIVVEAAYPTLIEEVRHRARTFGPLSRIPALRVMRRAGVDLDGVRPIDGLCAVRPRPVLLIYGELDADVPPGTAQAMFQAACGPGELWIVPGAGHQNYTEVAPQAYAAQLVHFFGGEH